jgi:hypothetical protein
MERPSAPQLSLSTPDHIGTLAGPLCGPVGAALGPFATDQVYELPAAEQVAWIDAALAALPPPGEDEPADGSEAAAYDDYFDVRRTRGQQGAVFAVAVLTAYQEVLLEVERGTSLTQAEWRHVQVSFRELVALVCGAPAGQGDP